MRYKKFLLGVIASVLCLVTDLLYVFVTSLLVAADAESGREKIIIAARKMIRELLNFFFIGVSSFNA